MGARRTAGADEGRARARNSSSSRSSRSGSRERKARPLRVEAAELHALDGNEFKKSRDLVAYAASNPGALSVYFGSTPTDAAFNPYAASTGAAG